jgi:hypothetical protein
MTSHNAKERDIVGHWTRKWNSAAKLFLPAMRTYVSRVYGANSLWGFNVEGTCLQGQIQAAEIYRRYGYLYCLTGCWTQVDLRQKKRWGEYFIFPARSHTVSLM